MHPCFRLPARVGTVLLATVLFAAPVAAFDCTPILSLATDGSLHYQTIGTDSVPGEPLCGTDYTGWDFHVYELVVPSPGPSLVVIGVPFSDGNPFSGFTPAGDLILLDACDPGSCLSTWSTPGGNIDAQVCLEAGTYTLVVASPDADGTNLFGIGSDILQPCSVVGTEASTWGAMKSRF